LTYSPSLLPLFCNSKGIVVKSYIINSKAYKLLVLMTVVLLASFNLVRKGRGLQEKQRWNSSIKAWCKQYNKKGFR
jgi:hypothetical protein